MRKLILNIDELFVGSRMYIGPDFDRHMVKIMPPAFDGIFYTERQKEILDHNAKCDIAHNAHVKYSGLIEQGGQQVFDLDDNIHYTINIHGFDHLFWRDKIESSMIIQEFTPTYVLDMNYLAP